MHILPSTLAAVPSVFLTTSVSTEESVHLSAPAINDPCMECGVIYEIKAIMTERRLPGTADERAPPTVPFISFPLARKPGAKPELGVVGSKEMRKELEEMVYEVIARFDDDRFVRIEVRDVSNLRVDDRVHVHQNRLEPVDKE